MPADTCGYAVAPGFGRGTAKPCQRCPLLRDDGRGSVGILVAGEQNLVVAPSPRLPGIDRERAAHSVAFRGGGVEQDRPGGVFRYNVEVGTVVRRSLFALYTPDRKCQCEQQSESALNNFFHITRRQFRRATDRAGPPRESRPTGASKTHPPYHLSRRAAASGADTGTGGGRRSGLQRPR